MKTGFFKKLTYCIVTIALLLCAFSAVACNKKNPPENPYAKQNNFAVAVTETDGATEYTPEGFTPTYGFVFYAGALINTENYAYLGNALAKQGYLTVIYPSELSYSNYDPNIPSLLKYPKVRFFVGGHDIGGGTAVRHAMDYAKYNYNVAGLILYAPTNFKKQVFENGELKYDENGNVVWDHFSTAQYNISTLLIEVDDVLRTEEMKAETRAHINMQVTSTHTLQNSMSIDFSVPSPDDNANAIRQTAIDYTMQFMLSLM